MKFIILKNDFISSLDSNKLQVYKLIIHTWLHGPQAPDIQSLPH